TRSPHAFLGRLHEAPHNEKSPLLRGFLEEPTPGFEPGTPSLRVNRICPLQSSVGPCRQGVSVSRAWRGLVRTIRCGPYTTHGAASRVGARPESPARSPRSPRSSRGSGVVVASAC